MIKIIFKGTWRESCERTEDRLIYVYIKSRTKSVVKFVRITSTSLCRRNSISSRSCNWAEINRRKVDRFILNKNYINSLSYHDCSCVRVFGQSLLINIVTVQIYFIYFLQCIRYEWKFSRMVLWNLEDWSCEACFFVKAFCFFMAHLNKITF